LDSINAKVEQFKKRFHEQRRQTKKNQDSMLAVQKESLYVQEQNNYLEKEIGFLEKSDENQQLIL
jgi:hypothetical protein